MAIQTTDNKYGVAKWIVDPVLGRGTHTTIAAALTSASSGETIFIRPGSYTENLTLKAGVNLCAFDCDGVSSLTTPNVLIIGKATATFTGSASYSGLGFETNSDYIIETTGAGTPNLFFTDCSFIGLNNSVFHYTATGGRFYFYNCQGNLATTGIAFFINSSSDTIIYGGNWSNDGASTTASAISGGALQIKNCLFQNRISATNASTITLNDAQLQGFGNNAAVTLADTSSLAAVNSQLTSGTASAISIGAGTSATVTQCVINSSNTNAITGAGTLVYSSLPCVTNSDINVTTQTPYYNQLGKYRATGQPAFLGNAASATDVTGDGTSFTIGSAGTAFTEIYDQDANFNTNGTFTAPVTGKYEFSSTILASDVAVGHTQGFTLLTTSNRNYLSTLFNPGVVASGGLCSFVVGALADMDAADTATIAITVSGGTKTVDINGASPPNVFFCGHLAC